MVVTKRLRGVKILLLGILLSASTAQTQTSTKNYIRIAEPMISVTTPASLAGVIADHTKVKVDISYFDALGRPLQQVMSKATPLANDLVVPIVYDAVGRVAENYLPYPAGTGNSFRPNSVGAQQSYYTGTSPEGQPTTGKAFSGVVFEESALNRIKQQAYPGEIWQPAVARTSTGGRTIVTDYLTNNSHAFVSVATTRRIIRYHVLLSTTGVPTLEHRTIYAPGQVKVVVTKSENWAGGSGTVASRQHTVEEYFDKSDRILLRRTFNGNKILSTYYVYDNLGNLCFVLPPETNPDSEPGAPSALLLDQFAYQYRYDGLGRMIEKKLPGREWENYVYNPAGMLVFSQDPRQQSELIPGFTPGQYHTFYKYDKQGRVILTGIERNRSLTRQLIQSAVDANVNFWEDRSAATGNVHGYTNLSPPQVVTVNDFDITEAFYYDSYADIPGLPHNQSANYSKLTNGLLVASKSKVIGTASTYLWTVNYYDDEGRITRQWKQHFLGGTSSINKFDNIVNEYNFNGQLTKSIRSHHSTSEAVPAVTVITEYAYDHRGRLINTWKTINTGTRTLLSRNRYNEVGQLRAKSIHSTNGTVFGQEVVYNYNTRGWLREISSPLFKQELRYTEGANKQYNGNIAYQIFTRHNTITPAALVTDTYTYTYDALNRITQGAMAGDKGRESVTYDDVGNIKTLVRTGTNSTVVDNLTFSYAGNRLSSVTDAAASTDANYQLTGTTNYTYDINGNVKARTNSSPENNINNVMYNYLNLPYVVVATSGNVTYTYDAARRKLRSVGGINGQTRDYIDGIEYVGGTMELIHTEEGRITRNGSTYTYHYFLKDHLGNNRVGFTQGTSVTAPNFTADYYPFGLQYRQYIRTGSPKNNYLYNGKELQDGIKQYDYGARFYDPVIGRWGSVDPMAEVSRRWSPYNYAYNNPMLFIDPDGMLADYFDQDGNYLGNDGVDDDKIRIVPVKKTEFSSNYNTLPFNFYNMDGSVNVDAGTAVSRDISDLSSTERKGVAEGVLGFYFEQAGYNRTDLQSGKIDNTGPWNQSLASAKMGGRTTASGHLHPGAVAIEVSYGGLGITLRNAADVKNLFVHEYGGHIGDLKNNPSMKVGPNRSWFENSATLQQVQHPTWNRVSPEFRSHIKTYQSKYLTDRQIKRYFP